MSKILIIGNHCCSNRENAEILRHVLDYFEVDQLGSHVEFTSSHVDSARWILTKKY